MSLALPLEWSQQTLTLQLSFFFKNSMHTPQGCTLRPSVLRSTLVSYPQFFGHTGAYI